MNKQEGHRSGTGSFVPATRACSGVLLVDVVGAMGSFTPKRNQGHKLPSSTPAQSDLGLLGAVHRQQATPHLQPTFARQAIRQMLQAHAEVTEERDVGLTAEAPPFGHDFSRIAVYPPMAGVLQTKLAINTPGDRYEQEADRIADQVMRMLDPGPSGRPLSTVAAPKLQRTCACGGSGESGGLCSECAAEKKLQRFSSAPSPVSDAPPLVNDVIRSPGEPLDGATRAFMERRFGYDFSHTRIHVGELAARSASAVNARAFTVGEHLVFGQGQYRPGMASGRQLLAHELAHVVQQSHAPTFRPAAISEPDDVSEHEAESAAHTVMTGRRAMLGLGASPVARLQRACGSALGKPKKDCTKSDIGIVGLQFLFDVGCDTLQSFEVDHLAQIVKTIPKGAPLNVHGYASVEGGADFNLELSCHRANKLAALILAARPDCNIYELFKHGTQKGPPGPEFWRAASVEIAQSRIPLQEETPDKPKATPPQTIPSCPGVPNSIPSTCAGRHEAYAAAQRCFPLNAWLPCVARTSANICRVIEAFNFRGDEGSQLSLCVSASYGAQKDLVRDKGTWLHNTNACIWGHWRAALEAMHDPTKPIPTGVTPEWRDAITLCRLEGVGTSACCEAHVIAEQQAIEHCGGYDDLLFGRLPTDVPSAPLCSDFVLLASGPLPFSKDFGNVADRIDYGDFICCGM